ncbi:MAG: hypothetical protein WBI20_06460 [Burkholderiaceae bacterium]
MSDIPDPGLDTLNEATEQYLRSSDQLSYPLALASKFPRIANELVCLKAEPEKLKACFDGLTKDQRGNRRGFTFEVLMDIHNLREYMLGDVNSFELNDTTKWVS